MSLLEKTVALVTGASSGIGEASALALARHGARVALVARRRERLELLARSLEGDGGSALVIEADLTAEATAREAVHATVEHFGRLDIVVNNAGVMLLGPIVEADTSEWRRMLTLNLEALMHVSHAALPHLLEAAQKEPRRVADLVNISSLAGRVVRNGSGVYNASKYAVGAFSESLRQEVTKRYVRVSLVEPGVVMTELAGHMCPEAIERMRARLGPLEPLQASDIADAIVYLVTRPRHMAVNEILIRPTEQEP